MRISRLIPGFHNGVSQQAPALRLPTQVEDAVNVYPSLVSGMLKRPPLKHIAKIVNSLSNNYYVHVINRDANEQYVVLIGDQEIRVFDINGNEKTVDTSEGLAYLDTTDPKTAFRALTIADYTFILNKNVEVEIDSTESAESKPFEAVVWVKRGVQENTYTVTLGGVDYSVTTTATASTYRTSQIASDLKAAIEAGSGGFTVYRKGSVLKISRSTDFTFSVWDSYGETGLMGFKHYVSKYTDLPPNCWDGVRVNVRGDGDEYGTDYYVEYESEEEGATGVWTETRGWDQSNKLKASTMPWQLVREEDGTFTLEKSTWSERMVGDDDTAPMPSFVGRTINDIFFYRNRLGFLADENICFSRAGDYFNFFPATVTDTLDDDPIDVAVSHVKVSILNHAVPYNKSLLLFSQKTQFICTSDTMLTPTDIRIDQTTEFDTSPTCKPVGQGANVFFATPMGAYSGIREYFMQEDVVSNDAADITAHCPSYLPPNIRRIIGSSQGDVLFFLSNDEPQNIYVYKYYWSGNEKLQSAWVKWTVGSDCEIVDGDIIETTLYFVVKRSDGYHLMSIDIEEGLEDGTLGFQVLLDNRAELTGVYDGGNGWTTWTLPFADSTDTPYTVVLGDDWGEDSGSSLSGLTRPSTTQVRKTGNWSDHSCIVGKAYTASMEPSTQYVKQDEEETKSIVGGRLQVLDFTMCYADSAYFKVEVTPLNRSTYTYTLSGRLGTHELTVGAVTFYTGSFRFPVLSKNDQVRIVFKNDSFLPSTWVNGEWTGMFVLLSQRR